MLQQPPPSSASPTAAQPVAQDMNRQATLSCRAYEPMSLEYGVAVAARLAAAAAALSALQAELGARADAAATDAARRQRAAA